MAQKRKTSSVAAINDKRVSRSIKNTPHHATDTNGKPCCPKCRAPIPDSSDYEKGKTTGEVIFYYRCPSCGQIYQRTININSI